MKTSDLIIVHYGILGIIPKNVNNSQFMSFLENIAEGLN